MNTNLTAVFVAYVAALSLGGCAVVSAPSTKEEGVVGNWRLLTVETISSSGQISTAWMGREPTGLITYQPNGLVSVQIMHDPKPIIAAGSRLKATPEELKNAFFGYYAYWGTYSVSAGEKAITHQLTASLIPEEVGITYKRFYALDGRRLVLTTAPFMYDGRELTNRLTWERMSE